MQGPIIDLIMLALLILFFGLQQRGQRRRNFRLWFAGWTVIFISLLVWEPATQSDAVARMQHAFQFDLLMLGTVLFIMSFAPREMRWARVLRLAALCYFPAAVGVSLELNTQAPDWALVLLVTASHCLAIFATLLVFPRRGSQRFSLVLLCFAFLILMDLTALRTPDFLPDIAVGELLMVAGVLYAGSSQAPRIVRLGGCAGFLLWGAFHIVLGWLEATGSSRGLLTLGQLWSVPKYMVAFSMILEISETNRAETARLAASYRELYDDFRLLFDKHPHPMWIQEADSRQILSANAAAVAAYGYTLDELLRMNMTQLQDQPRADDPAPAQDHHRCKDGRLITVEVTERGILFQGREARVLLALDVTEKERETRELERRATHDVLTGLPNRALVERRLTEALERAALEARKTAIVSLDLDHFKQVNDQHGHLVGDEVLRAAAQRLHAAVRHTDTVGRTGGEEFTAILCDLGTREDAARIASMMLQAMREPLVLQDRTLHMTLSIGIAVFPDDGADAETLRRLSDEALYRAKREGRNRVVFHADRELAPSAVAVMA